MIMNAIRNIGSSKLAENYWSILNRVTEFCSGKINHVNGQDATVVQ